MKIIFGTIILGACFLVVFAGMSFIATESHLGNVITVESNDLEIEWDCSATKGIDFNLPEPIDWAAEPNSGDVCFELLIDGEMQSVELSPDGCGGVEMETNSNQPWKVVYNCLVEYSEAGKEVFGERKCRAHIKENESVKKAKGSNGQKEETQKAHANHK